MMKGAELMRHVIGQVMAVLGCLACGLAAWAAPAEVWVDARFGPGQAGDYTYGAQAFSSIQQGVDAVAPGGVVHVAAGVYAEWVTVRTPGLALLGPQAGVDPTRAGARSDPTAEARLRPPRHDLSLPSGTLLTVDADHVTVAGLTLDGDNPAFSGGTLVNGADINAALGVGNLNADLQGVLIAHTIIRNVAAGGVRFDCPRLPPQPKGINAVVSNRIENLAPEGLGVRANGQHLRVAHNTILGATYGVQMHFVSSTQATAIPQVTGNTIEATSFGIAMVLLNDQTRRSGPSALVNGNTVRMTTVSHADFPATSLVIYYIEHQSRLLVCDNTFEGGEAGIQLWELPTANPTNVTIANTTIRDTRYGIWFRNWLPMPETGPARPSGAFFSGVTITDATEAGICLEGDARGDGPITMICDGVTVQGGPVGLLLKGPKSLLEGLPTLHGQTGQAIVATDGAARPQ